MLKKNTRVGIYVGPGVLGFTLLEEDWGNNVVKLRNKFEEFVIRKVLKGKLALAGVSGVSLTKDSVSVAGNDTASLERVPDKFPELFISDGIGSEVSNELGEPNKDFLVSETMERSGKTVQSSSKGEVGVRKGRANQVGSVGRYITSLVVCVDGKVESHKLNKFLVVGFSDHVAVVCGPIKGGIGGSKGGVITVKVVVDLSGNWDQVSDTVHAIFVNVFPVGGLVNTSFVSLDEFRLGVHESDGGGELRHWVNVRWESV